MFCVFTGGGMGREGDVIKNFCKSKSRSVDYNCRRNNKLNLLKCLSIVSTKINIYITLYLVPCFIQCRESFVVRTDV